MTKDEFKQWVDVIANVSKLTGHRTAPGVKQTYTLPELAADMSQHDKELAKRIVAWSDALDDVSNYISSKVETQK